MNILRGSSSGDEQPRDAILGHGAFVVTVFVGAITTLLSISDAALANIVGFCIATVLYCIIGTVGYTRAQQAGTSLAQITYFVVQLALAGLICTLGFAIASGDGAVWLVLMPLASHAVIGLRFGWAVLVALFLVCIFAGTLLIRFGSVSLQAVLQIAVAIAFVFLFSLIAAREQRNRMQVEQLAVQLRDANRKLSEYAAQVDELATTRERNRLARDVHDSLGHYLTTVNIQLEAARATLNLDPVRAAESLGKAQALTKEGLSEVRRSVAALRAGPTDNRSLVDAIDALVDEARVGGLDVNLAVTGTARSLSPQAEVTLFRSAQEGLTNVRKHADAKHVGVLLAFNAATVTLSVRDDGTRAEHPGTKGFGLIGLRERAQLLGGSLVTRVQGGFVLEVELPA